MIGRLLRGIRREGVGFFVTRASTLARRLMRYQRVIVVRYEGEPSRREETIVELSLERSRGVQGMPWDDEVLAARFREGARLYAVREGETLSAFAWTLDSAVGWIGEIGRTVELSESMTWVYDAVTPPEFRGRGYYSRIMGTLAAAAGPGKAFVYVRADNTPARRGLAKAGFVDRGHIVRILNKVSVRLDNTGPQLVIRSRSSQDPN